FTEGLGERVSRGLKVTGVPTSSDTAALARSLGIPLSEEITGDIDLAVDGADEIDPERRLIKGRGGALTREKLVALAARQVIIVADGSKLVNRLGRGQLPVEIVPFLWRHTRDRIASLGAACELRGGEDAPFRTDNGNLIVDLRFPEPLGDAQAMADALKQIPGVVEHGL